MIERTIGVVHNAFTRLVLVDQHMIGGEVNREDLALHQYVGDRAQPGGKHLTSSACLWETLRYRAEQSIEEQCGVNENSLLK